MMDNLYPSKPLESWDKAKELRRKLFWDIWKAHDEGKLLVQGVNVFITSLLAGLGEVVMAGIGPNFGRITTNIELLQECHELAAQKGVRQDTCAGMRMTLGALYKGIFYQSPSGEQVKPDLCLDIAVCPHQVKGNQIFRDYYNIPHLVIEGPPYFEGKQPHHHQFVVDQLHDGIEFLEKAFNRKYDDEKLIEAAYDEWDVAVLYAKCTECIKAIPAPIDSARFFPFMTPILRAGRHSKDAKAIFQMLLDELKDRVRDGIAIEANERARVIHDGNMPYYYGDMYRLTRKYGAILIGGRTMFGLLGAYLVNDDGSWEIGKTPKERGIELKNRDDALNSLADLLLNYSPCITGYQYPSMAREGIHVAKEWHADGVIMHIDRGCRAMTAGMLEYKAALEREGFPVVTYDGNNADPRDFNQVVVEDRLDTFMSRLGLSRLVD
ncbi:2-hydroxyacyl-CoA dehydratase [Chloroflexota bacterium]